MAQRKKLAHEIHLDPNQTLAARMVAAESEAEDGFMNPDIDAHLNDIIFDVNRVRKAVNDDARPSKLSEDEILSKLADISNAIDDLRNGIIGP